MIRAAVIGVGSMGKNHARVYSELPDVNLVGVADRDIRIAEVVASRYGGEPFSNYRDLLDSLNPDLVSIAVPTKDHVEVALEVIIRGVHLIIEKPIADSVEKGQQIIQAANQAKLKLMIGHVERFNPAIVELKNRLNDGELGQIYQIDARRQGPFPSRVMDIGVVVDLAVHDLDVIRYVSSAEVIRLYAETERRIHKSHEDMLSGMIRLGNGVVGTLTINWLTPTKIRELFVTGEFGMFRVDYLTQDLYFYENATINGDGWETMQVMRGISEGRMIRHVVRKREPLRLELESFLSAVRDDRPVPVTGHDGLVALRLAQSLVISGTKHITINF